MRSIRLNLFAVTIVFTALLVLCSGFEIQPQLISDSENPASINRLDQRIYSEIIAGNTDSLFADLQKIYRNAGWKDQEGLPKLEKQAFDIPFSRTSWNYITQSELMVNKNQAWQYWQMWSDSLTYGKWDPKTSFKDENEAFEVGNFTLTIIMAHELGHYYSEANEPDKYYYAAWENAADHYAVGLLHDLTSANDKLEKLLVRFRKVFMGDIYNAIPDKFRSKLEPDFNLYEHVFFMPAPTDFRAYASMQLVREGILLDNPSLTTRTCKDVLNAGNAAVATGDKVDLYKGQIGTHYFPAYDKEKNNEQEASLSKIWDGYGRPEMGCFDNGEIYSVVIKDSILTLSTLTPLLQTRTFDFTEISSKLDSLGGQKIIADRIHSDVVFHFNSEEKLNLYFLRMEPDSLHYSIVTCVISMSPSPQVVSTKSEKLTFICEGELILQYRSHNDQHVILDLFNYKTHETYRLRMNTNKTCTEEHIAVSRKFDDTPDLDALPPKKREYDGLHLGVDPLGNELVIEFSFIKFRSNNKQYTLCGVVNRIEVGTKLDIEDQAMIWSSKYGFINYDDQKKCAVGIKF